MTRLYVPSKSRTWILPRTMPSWLATGLPVTLVVDTEEVQEYLEATKGKVEILGVEEKGIGAARQAALMDSIERGHEYHYQIDDDHIAPGNTTDLMQAMDNYWGLNFVSAWKRQINFYQASLLEMPDRVVPTESNMTAGLRLIRNELLGKLGGFDKELRLAEDCEAHMRTGWATGVRPMLDKGVLAVPVGARFQPGGCQAPDNGTFNANALDTVIRLNERYGEGTASLKPWGKERKLRFQINIKDFWRRVDERVGVL